MFDSLAAELGRQVAIDHAIRMMARYRASTWTGALGIHAFRENPLFVRSLATMLMCIGPLAGANAQAVSPSAVTQRRGTLDLRPMHSNSPPTLKGDVQHGAAIGGMSGGVLGLVGIGAYVWANTRPTCCEQPPRKVRFSRIVSIETFSVVGGAIVGSVLGFSYHFNKPSQPASRAREPNGGRR